jgi:hypothetical protein
VLPNPASLAGDDEMEMEIFDKPSRHR